MQIMRGNNYHNDLRAFANVGNHGAKQGGGGVGGVATPPELWKGGSTPPP